MYKMPSAASGVATKVINSGPGKEVDKQTTGVTGKVGINTAPGEVAKAELNGGPFGGAKYVGGDVSNAYHTSIVDPVKKAAEHIKALAAGAGGSMGAGHAGMVQSPQMPQGFQGGKLNTGNIALQGPQGATINMGQDQFGGYQSTLASQLAKTASGQGPFMSDLALKQAQDQNQAAQFAQLASMRGNANPLAARTAMNNASDLSAQTARDATMAKLQEQQMAQQGLAGLAGQARGQDLQLATNQAQLNQQANLAGYQGGMQQMYQQAQLDQQYNELVAKYAAMGVDAQKANQMAAIEMQRNKNQMTGGLLSTAGTILGAYFGGPAGAAAAQQATTPQQTQPAVDDGYNGNRGYTNRQVDEGAASYNPNYKTEYA